jgi:hypothetical protein
LLEQSSDLRAQRGAAPENISAARDRKRGVTADEIKLDVVAVPLLTAEMKDAAKNARLINALRTRQTLERPQRVRPEGQPSLPPHNHDIQLRHSRVTDVRPALAAQFTLRSSAGGRNEASKISSALGLGLKV